MKFSLIAFLLWCLLPHSLQAQAGVDTASFNYDSLVAKIAANQTGYKTLSIHTKLVWDDGSTEQPVQANMRLLRDSLVWMSLTGPVGMEGARVLLTQDSFRMISKLTNEYIISNFGYLQNWIAFPVNFKMLQAILSGEAIDITGKAKLATYQDSMFVIYAETDKMLEKIWVNSLNYTLAKILLKDKVFNQSMTITFDAYNNLNGKPFSYKRLLDINRDGTAMKLSMDITKVRVNEEQSYPFEVSDKYKR